MTRVMAPFPAKYAVFEFVNTLQATFLAIFIKFEQNVYGHKISLRFGFGFDRTSMNRVMAPFSAKYAVFEFVNTLEVTFI